MRVIASAAFPAHFLGSRTYLHSTTIVPALREVCAENFHLPPLQRLSAQFHALTDHQGIFDLLDEVGNESLMRNGYIASFKLTAGETLWIVGLKPAADRITEQREFDEDALVSRSTLNVAQQSVTLLQPQGDALAVVIALNKRLHAALFESEGYEKWLLSKLDIHGDFFRLASLAEIRLQLKSSLAGVNTKVDITVNNQSVGTLHFSRKKVDA